jgi:hypothetical protein
MRRPDLLSVIIYFLYIYMGLLHLLVLCDLYQRRAQRQISGNFSTLIVSRKTVDRNFFKGTFLRFYIKRNFLCLAI